MASHNLKRAIGIFSNRRDAEQAIAELKNKGFPMHKLSVINKSSGDNNSLDSQSLGQPSITRVQGAKTGAIAGSIGVGSLALIVGLASLLIPGIGQILAIESLLTTFLGSGIAATAGGLYGAIQGWLVPAEQTKMYSDRFNRGDYLIIMEVVENEILIAESVLKHRGMRTWRVYDAS
ncbi:MULTISPECIES: hypothetical protein [Cyanophyceae]|uniref:hypothetical protein n=1 Tax=Cyanophyceae TaxID=3028117 RepID=UPI0016864D04|nr:MULTISPECIES: hypothetical protein [Cyanophyceae]MBD1914376.1 hypothetical protein [Phormidium sp. FACHB-77]MBD2028640.1 hypothetical protein [Phormidium sp. FACHB-322]MBD2053666.1 hypothetical protein [Leptolyngbya sp. FACHB-60]